MSGAKEQWCRRREDGKLECFMRSRAAVLACGAPKAEVVRVRLTPDEQGSLWCWHDAEKDEYCFVFDSLVKLSVCFTYGIEREEKRGLGTRLRVRAEVIE